MDTDTGVSPWQPLSSQPPTTIKPHHVSSQGCGHPGTDRALYSALIPPSIPPEELGSGPWSSKITRRLLPQRNVSVVC